MIKQKEERVSDRFVYGGFIDGKLDWLQVDDGFGGQHWRHVPALFKRRQEARCQYEDVRRVELTVGEPRKPFRQRRRG